MTAQGLQRGLDARLVRIREGSHDVGQAHSTLEGAGDGGGEEAPTPGHVETLQAKRGRVESGGGGEGNKWRGESSRVAVRILIVVCRHRCELSNLIQNDVHARRVTNEIRSKKAG